MSPNRIGRALSAAVALLCVGALLADCGTMGGGGGRRRARWADRQRQERPVPMPQQGGQGPVASAAGFQSAQVSVGGLTRSYLIRVPSRASGQMPLVFVFHGAGGSGGNFAETTNYGQLADSQGFIVVFPNGTNGKGGRVTTDGGYWNAGSGRGEGAAEQNNVDDLGFVRAMLAQIEGKYPVDRSRVYAAGFSKGGMFTYDLACNMADQFAAITTVSTTMTAASCNPSRMVPVFHIHGTADEVIPYTGGQRRSGDSYPPVPGVLEFWRKRDQCSAETTRTQVSADTTCYTYSSCARQVKYCLIDGGGHAWPGAARLSQRQVNMNVKVTQDFSATQQSWAWFQAHPMGQ